MFIHSFITRSDMIRAPVGLDSRAQQRKRSPRSPPLQPRRATGLRGREAGREVSVTVPVLSCPVQRGRGKGRRGTRGSTGGATPPRLVIAPGRVERRRVVRRPASGQAIPHHGGRCSVSCFAFVCSPIHLAAGWCRLSYRSARPERVGTYEGAASRCREYRPGSGLMMIAQAQLIDGRTSGLR